MNIPPLLDALDLQEDAARTMADDLRARIDALQNRLREAETHLEHLAITRQTITRLAARLPASPPELPEHGVELVECREHRLIGDRSCQANEILSIRPGGKESLRGRNLVERTWIRPTVDRTLPQASQHAPCVSAYELQCRVAYG